jgi:hypothetical protein
VTSASQAPESLTHPHTERKIHHVLQEAKDTGDL